MNAHEITFPKLEAYARNALTETERAEVEAHLAACEICQSVLAKHEAARAMLKSASEPSLAPQGRLRLYERINEERGKKQEALLKIPEALIAQVRATGKAVAESAVDVAKTSGAAAGSVGSKSAGVAKTMGRGMKSVGKKALGAGKKSAHHGKDMVDEAAQTLLDSGRILTVESAQVVEESLKNPLKAMVAPLRLAGKGMKAGARMAKGSLKIATSGVKGAASVMKGGLDVGAESVKQGGEAAGSMIDAAQSVLDARNKVAKSIGGSAKKIVNAKPEDEEEKKN
jgi:hypothetical protein